MGQPLPRGKGKPPSAKYLSQGKPGSLRGSIEFVAAAEVGSFSAAARQPGVSGTHVSRQRHLRARLRALIDFMLDRVGAP
jgi:hypothetical protein